MNNKFLSNKSNIKFIDQLKQSIRNCKSFCFSVSFIKKQGLVLIEKEIDDALRKGVKGKIITSTYQNFTDTASLNTFLAWMNKYPNFECRLDFNSFDDSGFHSKGYLFEYEDSYEFLVGSTNITRFALLKNVEWNVSISSKNSFNTYEDALNEFDYLWKNTYVLDQELIERYRKQLEYAIEKWDMDYFQAGDEVISPNKMQRMALKELRRYRDLGVNKALVVAAMATGKTFLAAFDARNYGAKRVLFVVHRDTILSDALQTFSKVFGNNKTYGIFTGVRQDLDKDFVFASNQMLSRHIDLFDKDEFDYIIIDECHHAVAESYKKIIEHFNPGFLLGLTATPERMDNQGVFELFDMNVPYELRLRDAIINDLVVPFHYYGIRDSIVNYGKNEKEIIAKEIANSSNCEFIKEQIEKYRGPGKLKAVAFCTTINHCKDMAKELNLQGYHTCSLVGENNLGERIKAFNDLQDDNKELEIICTVDILNEGVDIPAINMVLFLRPTESQTIFLQQLGRGLRKYTDKDFLTVLDFIGNNYDRSVQIAMALGTLGQSTFIEKSYLQSLVSSNFEALNIPGVVINLDRESIEMVLNNLKNVNFYKKDIISKDYYNFKEYIGSDTYPSHMDFFNAEYAPDLMRLIKAKIGGVKNKSYYSFLKAIGEEMISTFSDQEINLLDELSELLPLVRADEYLIIQQVVNDGNVDINKLVGFNTKVTKSSLENALYLLNKEEILVNDKIPFELNEEYKVHLLDLLEYGIQREEIEFGAYVGKFRLYGNYYKEQIFRVLEEKNLMFMKGTKFTDENTTYCFVNLHKDLKPEDKLNYKDKFISPSKFQWESETNTTLTNSTGKRIKATEVVHLFVRKMDNENGINLPYTYFGTGRFKNIKENIERTDSKTLIMDIELDNIVPDDYLFDFDIPDEEGE